MNINFTYPMNQLSVINNPFLHEWHSLFFFSNTDDFWKRVQVQKLKWIFVTQVPQASHLFR